MVIYHTEVFLGIDFVGTACIQYQECLEYFDLCDMQAYLRIAGCLIHPLLSTACVQADKLLSQDFKNMLDEIISFLPRDRQIMLYSATFPITVEEFIVRC